MKRLVLTENSEECFLKIVQEGCNICLNAEFLNNIRSRKLQRE
jgi:hypothetical protein